MNISDTPEKIRERIRQTISEANTVFKDKRIENLMTQIAFEFYKKGFQEANKALILSSKQLEKYIIGGREIED